MHSHTYWCENCLSKYNNHDSNIESFSLSITVIITIQKEVLFNFIDFLSKQTYHDSNIELFVLSIVISRFKTNDGGNYLFKVKTITKHFYSGDAILRRVSC